VARLRAAPEEFVVEELPLYPPCGEGAHTFVLVEKRLRTTEEVARELARAAAVPVRDVGYAGRKDRGAVARQWLSVPGLAPERARELEMEGVRVLDAVPHRHKLRTGHLAGNRFALRVREVDPAVAARAPAALARLVDRGAPNRFGEQRFGRDGENAERGLALLRGGRMPRDRRRARFWVSALQARVFNEVLDRRPLALHRLETGDRAVVHASGGLFLVEDAAAEQSRADAFAISPTGPVFGTRMERPGGAPAAREEAVMAELGLEGNLRPPRGIRMRGGRRALRVRPEEARVEPASDGLWLHFRLPAGSYATVVVDAVLVAAADDKFGSLGVSSEPERHPGERP